MQKASILADMSPQSDIITADRYLRELHACISGEGPCPIDLIAKAGLVGWDSMLKDAESRFTYAGKDLAIGDIARAGAALSKNSILDFDAVITTTRKDRDGDILETAGAQLDPACALLMFHDPDLPVGKFVSLIRHNKDIMAGRFAIFDTALGRDAAILVEGGALRISHGFEPDEYEPLRTKEGGRWHITKYRIMEVSLVSVPSNVDAVITSYSKGQLESDVIKAWAKGKYELRKKSFPGAAIAKSVEATVVDGGNKSADSSCSCHKGKDVAKETEVQTKGDATLTVPQHGTTGVDRPDVSIGQGPQQGNDNFPTTHSADLTEDEKLPGVDQFDPQNSIKLPPAATSGGVQNRSDPMTDLKEKKKPAPAPVDDDEQVGDALRESDDGETDGESEADKPAMPKPCKLLAVVDERLAAAQREKCSSTARLLIEDARKQLHKFTSMDPNGNGMGAGMPPDDKPSVQDKNQFDGTPKPDGASPQNSDALPKGAKQVDPGMNENVAAPNIPGSVTLGWAASRIMIDADELSLETLEHMRGIIDLCIKSKQEEAQQVDSAFELLLSE